MLEALLIPTYLLTMHNLPIHHPEALHSGPSHDQRSPPSTHTDQPTAPTDRAAVTLIPGTVLMQLSRRSGAPNSHSKFPERSGATPGALQPSHSSTTEPNRRQRGFRGHICRPAQARPVFRHTRVSYRRPGTQTWRVTFLNEESDAVAEQGLTPSGRSDHVESHHVKVRPVTSNHAIRGQAARC